MSDKYYVVWHDYDRNEVEEFATSEAAAARGDELFKLEVCDVYGTVVEAIICGERIFQHTTDISENNAMMKLYLDVQPASKEDDEGELVTDTG